MKPPGRASVTRRGPGEGVLAGPVATNRLWITVRTYVRVVSDRNLDDGRRAADPLHPRLSELRLDRQRRDDARSRSRRGHARTRRAPAVAAPRGRRPAQASRASRLISGTPARARETGQAFLASSAVSRKADSSIPGTSPVTSRSILAIVGAPSMKRRETVAWALIESGGLPASASAAL